MKNNKEDKHRNKSTTTTKKQIRWENGLLDESEKMAEDLGTSWSEFVRESVRNEMKRIKNK